LPRIIDIGPLRPLGTIGKSQRFFKIPLTVAKRQGMQKV